MRKIAITLALASTALATPALARDNAWYVGLEAGPTLVEDIKVDVNGINNTQTMDVKYGSDFDGIVGYDFGGFRLEAEAGYKSARNKTLNNNVSGFANGGAARINAAGAVTYPAAGTYPEIGGKTTALSFMVNAMLDFGEDDGVQGFIGGGAGVARVKADGWRLNQRGAYLDDSDTVFAWQAIAGIRAPLSRNVDATLKYRFFNADNVKLIGISGREHELRYRSHSILGGLTFNFGEPEAPPPPPVEPAPPPPPPAPAPVVTCEPGPYIVFFDWDKSDIKPEAAAILDDAVAKYQSCGNVQVMLAGHADRSGAPTYNVGLSERRNASVQSYLTGRGIPGGVITTQAFGETQLRVETADGVREVQNRNVQITYGPGSGM